MLTSAFGTAQTLGNLENVDTSAFSAGDILYLSDTTAGDLTNVAPSSPSIAVKIGVVLTSHATTGKIGLQIQNAISQSLDQLSDVTISSPVTDQVLKYNGSGWINANFSTTSASSGYTLFPQNTASVSDIETMSPTPSGGVEVDDTAIVSTSGTTTAFPYVFASPFIGGTQID